MPLIKTTSNLNIEKPEAAHNAWEQAYWRLATLLDLWATQIAAGNTVVSGGTLTLNGTNGVDLEATVVAFAGQTSNYAIGAQTSIAALASGNTYIVYVDTAGALQVLSLDASGLWSGALPAQFVLLGLVYEVEGAWVLHNRPLKLGRGQANGVAALDGAGLVAQEPASKGLPNGVASLDGVGAVPLAQIPVIPYTKLSGGDGSFVTAAVTGTTYPFTVNRRWIPDQLYGSVYSAAVVWTHSSTTPAFNAYGSLTGPGWGPMILYVGSGTAQDVGMSWRYLT